MCARRGLTGCVPSLADLSQAVLGQRLRADGAPHDCAADAAAAMRLAQHLISARAPGVELDPPQQKVRLRSAISCCGCCSPAGQNAWDKSAALLARMCMPCNSMRPDALSVANGSASPVALQGLQGRSFAGGGETEVERAPQVPKEQLCKLLVHALPAGTAEEDVAALLPQAAPRPVGTEGDCGAGGKALLVFASAADANQAFKLLQVGAHAAP